MRSGDLGTSPLEPADESSSFGEPLNEPEGRHFSPPSSKLPHALRAGGGEAGGGEIGETGGSHPRGPRVLVAAIVRSMRPRQWIKNILVFAAPGAAGALIHPRALGWALETFVLFCLVAGGTYLCNDAIDADADSLHPLKRHRPIAAGILPRRTAMILGIGIIVVSVLLGLIVSGLDLAIVLAVYASVTLGYSAFLKREPVVELAAVASGFVLRAIAGGVATHVFLSNWFLIVASFGSLFMVTGKRYAEFKELGPERAAHRTTLGSYSLEFLSSVSMLSAAVAITAYCLWAFERSRQLPSGAIFFELSIIPFVIALLRYGLLLDQGKGGAPEEVVLGDRRLQIFGLVLAILFALGVYA